MFSKILLLQQVPAFTSQFISKDLLESKPLKGLRVGIIRETIDDGVDPDVISSVCGAACHLEELGCIVTEVFLSSGFSFRYLPVNCIAFSFPFRYFSVILPFLYSNCRSHYPLSPLGYQPTISLLHLSHLQTCHVMMVLGDLQRVSSNYTYICSCVLFSF